MKFKNKNGQFVIPMVTFIFIIIGVFIISLFMLKLADDILDPYASALNNISSGAGDEVLYIKDSFVGFWDWFIIIVFVVNVILLLLTAFLIDTHPIFLVLYILSNIFLMIFAPEVIQVVDKVWDSPQFVNQVANMPMTDFLRTNFAIVILGIMMLAGVVMYAKIKIFPSGGGVPAR